MVIIILDSRIDAMRAIAVNGAVGRDYKRIRVFINNIDYWVEEKESMNDTNINHR